MNSQILDSDSLTGITTIFHPSVDGDSYTIETVQNVTDIVEANKLKYNDFDQRAPFKGDGFHQVASLPLAVYFQLKKEGRCNQGTKATDFLKWLDDKDNRLFRTRPGSLSK